MLPRSYCLLLASLTLLGARESQAAPPGGYDAPNYVSYQRPPPERRGGFVFGLNLGLGLGAANGYPNVADQVGVPAYKESTGIAFDNQLSLWIGGALRDWLTVGFGFALASASGSDRAGTNAGPIFKIEGFPLYPLGGAYRDLGFSLDGGLGAGTIVDPSDPGEALAGGGSTSQLGLTLFYEPFRFWAVSTGPSVTYAAGFGQIYTHHQVLLGWRFVIYSGQPKKKAEGQSEKKAHASLLGRLLSL